MDIARAPHNAQTRLKLALTPHWTPEMGHRLKVARMRQLRTQRELAGLLSTPGKRISQQQVAGIENGRLGFLDVNWARLESVLGTHTGYVLIARDHKLYNERKIAAFYFNHKLKTARKNANPMLKGRRVR